VTSPKVYFDVTSILVQALRVRATGIERTELGFARIVDDAYGEDCVFVVVTDASAYLIPRPWMTRLLRSLTNKWLRRPAWKDRLLPYLFAIFTPVPPLYYGTGARRLGFALLGKLSAVVHRLFFHNAEATLIGENAVSAYFCASQVGLPANIELINRITEESGVRVVFYLHDLLPILRPEQCLGYVRNFRATVDNLIDSGATFVFNSEYTEHQLLDYVEPTQRRVVSAGVVYPGFDLDLSSARPPAPVVDEEEAYFVYVSTIQPRKNHALLLRVWDLIVRQHGDRSPKLLLIGARGWGNEAVFERLDDLQELSGYVIELNDLSDPEKNHYLSNANGFLFPSFDEGFGMPLIEAASFGLPIVASDLDVFRELLGDQFVALPTTDAAGWMERVVDLSAGKRRNTYELARFSWKQQGAQLLEKLARN
jgi:glycosyltransferase involved in cell wall biosynthesis